MKTTQTQKEVFTISLLCGNNRAVAAMVSATLHHFQRDPQKFSIKTLTFYKLIMKLKFKTRASFHYEYASAVMMGLIFLGVKQRDAIKHI